jgi:hypothetical protein
MPLLMYSSTVTIFRNFPQVGPDLHGPFLGAYLMPLGPQLVTYGNVQSTWVLTVTLTPTSTSNPTTTEQSFTIQGLQVGDEVSLAAAFAYTSLVQITNTRVSAANTLTVAFTNQSGGTLTAPAGIYNVEVNRPLVGLSMTVIQ